MNSPKYGLGQQNDRGTMAGGNSRGELNIKLLPRCDCLRNLRNICMKISIRQPEILTVSPGPPGIIKRGNNAKFI